MVFDKGWTKAYQDETFLVQLSFDKDESPFIHVDVTGKLTPNKVKLFREVVREISSYLFSIGYDYLYTVTPKPKFVNLIVGCELAKDLGKVLNDDVFYLDLEEYLYG